MRYDPRTHDTWIGAGALIAWHALVFGAGVWLGLMLAPN